MHRHASFPTRLLPVLPHLRAQDVLVVSEGYVRLHRTAVLNRALLRLNESAAEPAQEPLLVGWRVSMEPRCPTKLVERVGVTADVWSFVLR